MSKIKYETTKEYIAKEVKLLSWYLNHGHTEQEFVTKFAVQYELHHKKGA